MTLAPQDVHVWWRATESMNDAAVREAIAVLSPDERDRHDRFRFAGDRRDFAAAHALLRTSLSRYSDQSPETWQFHTEPGGKPVLGSAAGVPRFVFNLSHTTGLVACAIAGGPQGTNAVDVGIDVEATDRPVDDRVASRFFSTGEAAEVFACPPGRIRGRRFFELWTLKEAYLKAVGVGLAHPLDTVRFARGEQNAIVFTPPADVDPDEWHFAQFGAELLSIEEYCLAVAVRRAPHSGCSITLMPPQ